MLLLTTGVRRVQIASLADVMNFFNRNFCPDAITDAQKNNIKEIIPLIINIYLTAKYRKFKYY